MDIDFLTEFPDTEEGDKAFYAFCDVVSKERSRRKFLDVVRRVYLGKKK